MKKQHKRFSKWWQYIHTPNYRVHNVLKINPKKSSADQKMGIVLVTINMNTYKVWNPTFTIFSMSYCYK